MHGTVQTQIRGDAKKNRLSKEARFGEREKEQTGIQE